MATLANVESELAERIRGMQTDAGNQGLVLVITTGYRSLDEQWRLYNDMIEAKKKYGKNWQKYAALAAYPGTSDHGRNPATAVDLACASATKENIARHGGLATKWGLARTVPSEYWHLQLARSRGSVPAGVPTEQEVRMIAIEPVGTATNPSGAGGWVWGRRGHVYGFDGSPYYGGWTSDQPGPENRSGRDCIALVPTLTGMGYWLVSDTGEIYAYGDAPWPGNYNSAWGAGAIIGAFRNGRIPRVGGVTLVRDDGQNLNLYRLPV
jgi:hypothetical protein